MRVRERERNKEGKEMDRAKREPLLGTTIVTLMHTADMNKINGSGTYIFEQGPLEFTSLTFYV